MSTTVAWSTVALPDAHSPWWAHPGAATGADGTVYLGAADGCHVHRVGTDGAVTTIPVPTIECHGLAVASDGGLWIADPGRKALLTAGATSITTGPGRVVRVDGAGALVHELTPPMPGWMPTGVAVVAADDVDSRVWVADGYGLNEVHAFDEHGRLLWTSDGSSSGAPFSTPHGIAVDSRGPEPVLRVADRGNRRIVTLSLDGDVLDSFGADVLTSPSGLAVGGDTLWVSELFGAIVGFDPAGSVVARVGDASEKHSPGWPNARDDGTLRPPTVEAEQFQAPHGITARGTNEVIVTEWMIGGRASILTFPPRF